MGSFQNLECQPCMNKAPGCLGGTIEVSDYDYLEGTPTMNKPWFINPGLTLLLHIITIFDGSFNPVKASKPGLTPSIGHQEEPAAKHTE